MSKGHLYKIDNKQNNKADLTSFIVGIFVYAIVIFIASTIFNNLYVESFLYALIAATILSMLNYTIKPVLVFLTLPLNIMTLGITYPIVNMIILKICDLLMGKYFIIHGFLAMFFISIFISFLKLLFDKMITNNVGGN